VSTLEALGWDQHLEESFSSVAPRGGVPGRVGAVHRERLSVFFDGQEALASVGGRLTHAATSREELPVVGDWLVLSPGGGGHPVVEAVLPRRSVLLRRSAGERAGPQPLVANADVLAAAVGLDADFNVRRLERYVGLAAASGVEIAIILTKTDLADGAELSRCLAAARAAAPGSVVLPVSAADGTGLGAVGAFLEPRRTYALLGSSGVGKSTLVNALLGRGRQRTAEVRARDGRGRHATTRRELFLVPSGALLVDTPGLRELGLWGAGEALGGSFADVAALAAACRFRNCRHETEPGCAVRTAVDEGRLDAGRVANLEKLKREEEHLLRRADPRKAREEKEHWKRLTADAWERSRGKRW
jgi:ribosome biogenesis GTPase